MPTLTRAANCRHSLGRHWVAICFRYVPRVVFRRTAHRRSPPVPFHKSFRATLLCKIFVGPAQPTCPILRQYFAAKSKSGKPGSSFSPSTCKYELAQPCHEAGVIAFVLTKYFSWGGLGLPPLTGALPLAPAASDHPFRSRERLICGHESRTNGCTAGG